MEEQSDTPRTTPRTNAKERETYSLTFGDDGDPSLYGVRQHSHHGWKLARDLERELAAATRERDEARAELALSEKNVGTYMAERNQARDVVKRARAALDDARAALRAISEESDDEGARECASAALAATEPKP